MFGRKQQQSSPTAPRTMEMDLQWGGYYSFKRDDGTYGIFRLIDFNRTTRHAALYRDSFPKPPTLAEAEAATPFIMHAPMAAASLFNEQDLRLIGGKPFVAGDLEGWGYYMQQTGVTEETFKRLVDAINAFARQQPVRVRLTEAADGGVTVEQLK
ncbi:MAG TPA: hypothetical protein VJP80_07030 [Candidatus Saccharimonadales bacterium]|nr:hypothetical protein [Candidatus Saccharimonadales bacterium]